MESLEKAVVLAIIDQYWKEHLRNMDDLRSNVQLARFEQKDPLLIYKFESYELFKAMVQKMNGEVAAFLMRCTIPTGPDQQQVKQAPQARPAMPNKISLSKENIQNIQQQQAANQARQAVPAGVRPGQQGAPGMPPPPRKIEPVRTEKKVLPNDPCPCGSGKKFKKCHGAG
jgi:preprotein translocase subunit SecA